MRILALSNEATPNSDPDIRWGLSRLRDKGSVAEYEVYSTPARVRELGPNGAALEVADLIRESQPDTVIFCNSGSCRFTPSGVDRMRAASASAVWFYSEGDAFAGWRIPYPRWALPTVSRCDAAALCSDGYMPRLLTQVGVKRVVYAPSWVNYERFSRSWQETNDFESDVVFIGNNVRSRVRRIPGARERADLVSHLQRRYGSRLAIYGAGWKGIGARGRCSFSDVPEIYARSRVAVGIDHVSGAFYFSNRLPIALASGVPLAQKSFIGRKEILPGMSCSQFFDKVGSADRAIDWLLERSEHELRELSDRERELAVSSLGCDAIIGYLLDVAGSLLAGSAGRAVSNPWLGSASLLDGAS
ncbi:MAG: hypothetical protein Q7W44_03960 [Coriobacteriia bacterium]|nr:hypothetical protein [Coriobacteriia bacterium]